FRAWPPTPESRKDVASDATDQNCTPIRRPAFQTTKQLFLVLPCRSVNRFGIAAGLGTSRQAPPTEMSTTKQSTAGVLASAMILPVLDTRPDGRTRANRRFSRDTMGTCLRGRIANTIITRRC